MRKIISQFTDTAMQLLSDCSVVANLYEQKDPKLLSYFKTWLERCEKLLKDNNRPEQAKLAAIRTEIIAGSVGIFNSGLDSSPSAKRKKNLALIMQALREVSELLYAAYREESERLENARGVLNQVVLVALQSNMIPHSYLAPPIDPSRLQAIWNLLQANPELQKGINQALAVVSLVDAMRIVDESLSNIMQQHT